MPNPLADDERDILMAMAVTILALVIISLLWALIISFRAFKAETKRRRVPSISSRGGKTELLKGQEVKKYLTNHDKKVLRVSLPKEELFDLRWFGREMNSAVASYVGLGLIVLAFLLTVALMIMISTVRLFSFYAGIGILVAALVLLVIGFVFGVIKRRVHPTWYAMTSKKCYVGASRSDVLIFNFPITAKQIQGRKKGSVTLDTEGNGFLNMEPPVYRYCCQVFETLNAGGVKPHTEREGRRSRGHTGRQKASRTASRAVKVAHLDKRSSNIVSDLGGSSNERNSLRKRKSKEELNRNKSKEDLRRSVLTKRTSEGKGISSKHEDSKAKVEVESIAQEANAQGAPGGGEKVKYESLPVPGSATVGTIKPGKTIQLPAAAFGGKVVADEVQFTAPKREPAKPSSGAGAFYSPPATQQLSPAQYGSQTNFNGTLISAAPGPFDFGDDDEFAGYATIPVDATIPLDPTKVDQIAQLETFSGAYTKKQNQEDIVPFY